MLFLIQMVETNNMVIAFNLNTISPKLLDNITMWHMFHSVMDKRNIFSYVFTNDYLQYLTYLCVFSINKISICVDFPILIRYVYLLLLAIIAQHIYVNLD